MTTRFPQSLFGLVFGLPLSLASMSVMAQDASKCDFSKSIGTCQAATAPRADGGVFIFTDSLNCASVDYQADGRKRRVFITEGRGEDPTAKEDINVTSCNLFAAIEAPKPMVAPQAQTQTPAVWTQSNGTVLAVGQGTRQNVAVPTLSTIVPSSKPATQPKAAQAAIAPSQANSSSHQQLEGTWCDQLGQPKLTVMGSGINMMHKPGKEIPAPFVDRQTDGMVYSTKRLFTTFSGKIGLDARSQELVWEDRVSPGISKVHYLRPCR